MVTAFSTWTFLARSSTEIERPDDPPFIVRPLRSMIAFKHQAYRTAVIPGNPKRAMHRRIPRMRKLRAIWRVAPFLVMGALIFATGSLFAQETFADELQAETWENTAVVDDGLWERLETVHAALNESVVSGITEDEVAERAQAAADLLLGDTDEPGLIAHVPVARRRHERGAYRRRSGGHQRQRYSRDRRAGPPPPCG